MLVDASEFMALTDSVLDVKREVFFNVAHQFTSNPVPLHLNISLGIDWYFVLDKENKELRAAIFSKGHPVHDKYHYCVRAFDLIKHLSN